MRSEAVNRNQFRRFLKKHIITLFINDIIKINVDKSVLNCKCQYFVKKNCNRKVKFLVNTDLYCHYHTYNSILTNKLKLSNSIIKIRN